MNYELFDYETSNSHVYCLFYKIHGSFTKSYIVYAYHESEQWQKPADISATTSENKNINQNELIIKHNQLVLE